MNNHIKDSMDTNQTEGYVNPEVKKVDDNMSLAVVSPVREKNYEVYMPWLKNFEVYSNRFLERLSYVMWKVISIGVILHVAASFAPELRDLLPFFFDFYDGALHLVNFFVTWAFKFLGFLFRGNLRDSLPLFNDEFGELISQFFNWLNTL